MLEYRPAMRVALALLGIACTWPAAATGIDVTISLDASELNLISDIAGNPGVEWRAGIPVGEPLRAGAMSTTIAFAPGERLVFADTGDGFFTSPTRPQRSGLERVLFFLVLSGDDGRVAMSSASVEFLDVDGALLVDNPFTVTDRELLTTGRGFAASRNFVDAGASFSIAGLRIETSIDTNERFTLDEIQVTLQASDMRIAIPEPGSRALLAAALLALMLARSRRRGRT